MNKDFKKMLSANAEFKALSLKEIHTASDGTRKVEMIFFHFLLIYSYLTTLVYLPSYNFNLEVAYIVFTFNFMTAHTIYDRCISREASCSLFVDCLTHRMLQILFTLDDGLIIETVVIPCDRGRTTVCVSSQVGCAMNCQFCFTGRQAFFTMS